MPTSDSAGDAARPSLRLPPLLRVPARPQLTKLSHALAARNGSVYARAAVPLSVLASAAGKLAASGGDLASLTPRERKATVELFWNPVGGWHARREDVVRWLEWASRHWNGRIGTTRVAMSHLRNFDPESLATPLVGRWLAARASEMHGPFGTTFGARRLHEPSAPERIAGEMARGDAALLDEIGRDVRSSMVLKGSGFLVAVAELYGRRCGGADAVDVGRTAERLLAFTGEKGLAGDRGSGEARDRARVSMVTGVVAWGTRSGANVEAALGVALSLAGDPRMPGSQWRGMPDATRGEVEGWLTARTLENLFRVIEELRTDRQDMARDRARFWRGYLPYIKRAFLLCAPRAVPYAEALGEPFGLLDSDQKDHCGVLMQIVGPSGRRLTMLDVNKNAAALCWPPDSTTSPPFFQTDKTYLRSRMRRGADEELSHHSGWQSKFANLIEAETGIRRPEGPRRG